MFPFEDETFDSEFDTTLGLKLSHQNPVVIVLTGTELGKRFPLNDASYVIGRNPDKANIVISDRTVSGMHSRIDYSPREQQYFITDLQSRNGILVNSQKTDNSPLSSGDKIFIGATILKFTFEDAFEDKFHSELNQLMNIDGLTGLPVKRIFDQELRKEFFNAKRRGKILSLLMMDLDGLKQINDTLGHQLGSHSISESGKIIGAIVRKKGIASRYGGDEFIAFMRNMPLSKAEAVGESIRLKIAAHTFELNGNTATPTISIGVAELTQEMQTTAELIKIADDALYRAKEAGRNIVSR